MGAGGTITVLGLGDILLQDEGFGVHFVCWLSQRRRFDGRAAIVDGGTLGYNLLDTICSSGHVIVIDVLHMAELTGGPPGVTFLCIVPESYGDMNLEMTQRMKDASPRVERLLLEELDRLGVSTACTGAVDA